MATRYDKRDYVYRGIIDVASIRIWLRDPLGPVSRSGTFPGPVAGKGKGYCRAARSGARACGLSTVSEVSEAHQ